MILTKSNYFSPEASARYWSVSQFKAFDRCEAAGYAESQGEYVREETDALLIGSYVDAYFSDEMEQFEVEHAGQMFSKRDGSLLAKFRHADDIIARVRADSLMMDYLAGDKQVVFTADLFDLAWKCKMDVYNGSRIVDFKTVKDFEPVYDRGYGWRSWVEYWGYDIQGAIYQKIEQVANCRPEPLPFFLVAVTKEKTPDIKVLQIPQAVLDVAYKIVESKIERFDLIKTGEVEPVRCGKCDYCKKTKVLTRPEVYDIEE